MLNKTFMLLSAEEQMISVRLRKPKGHESFQLMSSEMINQFLNYGRHNSQFNNRKIGDIMVSRGFQSVHKKDGNFFKVVEIPFDMQQNYIAMDDYFENKEPDDSQDTDNQQLELPF